MGGGWLDRVCPTLPTQATSLQLPTYYPNFSHTPLPHIPHTDLFPPQWAFQWAFGEHGGWFDYPSLQLVIMCSSHHRTWAAWLLQTCMICETCSTTSVPIAPGHEELRSVYQMAPVPLPYPIGYVVCLFSYYW